MSPALQTTEKSLATKLVGTLVFSHVVDACLIAGFVRLAFVFPHASLAQRLLLLLCFTATLARCALLGALARTLLPRLRDWRRELHESAQVLEERDRSLARAHAELKRQATHDSVTGLANRVLFVGQLQQAIQEQRAFAICAFDMNRFKAISDSPGHGAGDALLRQVADRLVAIARTSDTLAHAGGDQFLLLLRDVCTVSEIEPLLGRWMTALALPYRVSGLEFHVTPSIGIARFPADGAEAAELMARAYEALYHARRHDRSTFRFFDPCIMEFPRERLEGELRSALAPAQLALHGT